MSHRLIRFAMAVPLSGLVLGACGSDDDSSGPDAGPSSNIISIAGGSFAPLDAYTNIRGKAQIVRMADGTRVEVHVEGLQPSTAYEVHVHALPCEVLKAGPHYKIDPTVADTVATNELWPSFTTDDKGMGRQVMDVAHLTRMDAQAVIVHDPADNARMACANLAFEPAGNVVLKGELTPYAAATAMDMQIAGTAEVTISATGTEVKLEVQGLDASSIYPAHVHALPCEVNAAGDHYKKDPSIMETVETNELWPAVQPSSAGTASVSLQDAHVTRMDAQAVVIHRMDATTGMALKVACATLKRDTYADLKIEGTAARLLPDGTALGYTNVTATASITRKLDGSTQVQLQAAGLKPNKEYPVHVHAYTCDLENGGPHYKKDPSITDTVLENEIWPDISTDASGSGTANVTADHLARPEAQALVIHGARDEDPTKRVACIDLQ